jgi:RNA polymerase sigma-70 factor, ECF subfamily
MSTITLRLTPVSPAPPRERSDLTQLADEELIGRMLQNDDRAWQTFLRRYGRLLLSTIDRVLSRFSNAGAADREDVYGALIASLLANDMRKLRSFDTARGYKLSTWLGLLASHCAYDHLRDARRRGRLADAVRATDLQPVPGDTVRLLVAREECDRVSALCARLTARDRVFFELLYVRGESPEAVASRLGISTKTVYTKNFKLRAKLQPALDAQGARGAAVKIERRVV